MKNFDMMALAGNPLFAGGAAMLGASGPSLVPQNPFAAAAPAMMQAGQNQLLMKQMQRQEEEWKAKQAKEAALKDWSKNVQTRMNAPLASAQGPLPNSPEGWAQELIGSGVPELQTQGMEALMKVKEPRAPIKVGNTLVDPVTLQPVYEGKPDPAALTYEQRVELAKLRGNGGQPPANIQEWNAYQKMSPEEREQYLAMKRANPHLNLGGEQVQMSPVIPGRRLDSQAVSPKPEQMPDFKASQAAAVSTAESNAKAQNSSRGLNEVIDTAESILRSGTGNTPTASGVGALVDRAAGFVGASPDGAAEAAQLEAIGGALTSKMPRMEGPQSNIDQENYRTMAGRVGDRTLPIEQRLAALQVVKQLYGKYASQQPANPSASGASGDWGTPGGWSIRKK